MGMDSHCILLKRLKLLHVIRTVLRWVLSVEKIKRVGFKMLVPYCEVYVKKWDKYKHDTLY